MAGLHLIRNENNFGKGRGGLQSNPAVYFGNFWRFSGQRARFRERVPTILQLVVAREITELGSIKVTMSFLVHFSMEREGGRDEMEHFFWNRQPIIISNLAQLREEGMLERLVDSYKEEIARWQEMGSGWVVEGIKTAYLRSTSMCQYEVAHTSPLHQSFDTSKPSSM